VVLTSKKAPGETSFHQSVYNEPMAQEKNLKFRFTLGSVIMWLSLPLPFVTFQFREFARKEYLVFELTAMVLVIGYLVFCWEDFRAKRPFSREMLTIVVFGLVLCMLLAPAFSSSA
jgi:hypothetical protein